MNETINQISGYFETVPLWPFVLFGLLGLVAVFVEILNRKRRADAIDMYPQHKRWPKNINTYLCSRLPGMQQNFEVLRVFLPQDRLLSYNTDWNNYCDFCRNITDEKIAAAEQPSASDQFADTKQSTRQEPDPKEVFHKLVSDLLKHTHI